MAAAASPIFISSSSPVQRPRSRESDRIAPTTEYGSRVAAIPAGADTGFCTASAFVKKYGIDQEKDEIVDREVLNISHGEAGTEFEEKGLPLEASQRESQGRRRRDLLQRSLQSQSQNSPAHDKSACLDENASRLSQEHKRKMFIYPEEIKALTPTKFLRLSPPLPDNIICAPQVEDQPSSSRESYFERPAVGRARLPRLSAQASEGYGTRQRKDELDHETPTAHFATTPTNRPSPTKRKSTAKKARTITALAIAHWRDPMKMSDDCENDSRNKSSVVVDHISTAEQSLNYKATDEANQSTVPKKRRRKVVASTTESLLTHGEVEPEPKGRARSRAKKKKETPPTPRIPSPFSAQRCIAAQDLVFGTSSQLAYEKDAPSSYLRDLQTAIKESEQLAAQIESNDGFEAIEDRMSPQLPGSVSKVAKVAASRNLWAAGDRDDQGSLLPAEAPPSTPEHLLPLPVTVTIEDPYPVQPAIEPLLYGRESEVLPVALQTVEYESPSTNANLYSLSMSLESKRPKLLHQRSGLLDTPLQQISPNIPLTARGIKTSTDEKSKTKKTRRKATDKANTEVEETRSSVTTKRPQGRPRKTKVAASSKTAPTSNTEPASNISLAVLKDSASNQADLQAWTHIDEIEDSEAETNISSSPPRRASPNKTSPLDFVPSPPVASDTTIAMTTAKASADAAQKVLFSQISRAIRSAPRSMNSQSPSWHEKILMYDPIVLENLTAWLNDGPLRDCGRGDAEAPLDPATLQKWCEERSICCLWREGLRGGVKAQY